MSPTRAAGRRRPVSSPTCPTARRSCRARSPARRPPAPFRSSTCRQAQETEEIPVGLQPTALYLHGTALFVANSNDDSVSVIDTQTEQVAQTVEHQPGARARQSAATRTRSRCRTRRTCWSASAATTRSPCTATTASTAPIRYLGADPDRLVSGSGPGRPGARRRYDRRHQRQGHRRPRPEVDDQQGPRHAHAGAGSRAQHLRRHRQRDDLRAARRTAAAGRDAPVFTDNAWKQIPAINAGADDTVPSVIPPHIGGSSPIKHVFVIVKENRTYDQVLGDLGRGQRRSGRGAVRRAGHPEPARARAAVRRSRQLLRRGHAVGRRSQLDRAGRGQRLRREGVRRVLPLLSVAGRRRARLPA